LESSLQAFLGPKQLEGWTPTERRRANTRMPWCRRRQAKAFGYNQVRMETNKRLIELPSPAATTHLGRQLGRLLFPGAIVALSGCLGAGKTFFVRAVAEGLGVAGGQVVASPTFVLIQEYQGRLPIYHFDLYRLGSPGEFFDLGAGEYLEGQGVCLIEWADKFANWMPAERLDARFEIVGDQQRRLELLGHGQSHAELVLLLEG
jgi:tRNA threonylcarbamoyladenosine biosynthesis protein TsaE